jgi:hypothetical protein
MLRVTNKPFILNVIECRGTINLKCQQMQTQLYCHILRVKIVCPYITSFC